MGTSKEVFALRKEGSLDEAYAMASEVIIDDPHDEWNIKALAWCLYDLTKRAVNQNDYTSAKSYVEQLEELDVNELDDVLKKSIEHAKVLASPEKRIILQAKEESKQGNHQQALLLFRQAILEFPNDIDLNTQFGWELQKEGKLIFDSEPINILKARQLLAEYIKLRNERPSQLHSLYLRFADKIKDNQEFNLITFLKLWDLNNLREEDFESFVKDGKTYPSIAERIIQHAAKLILDRRLRNEVNYFIPFIDHGIAKFSDNIWLVYYKSKLLYLINQSQEAIEFLIPVVKEKITEFWVWNFLAELVFENDIELAISCYCKSLLCKGEDKFLANVRVKLAELLLQKELWNEAKYEIDTALKSKEAEGVKIPERLKDYQKQEWYNKSLVKKNNNDYYASKKSIAEEFIFNSLSWLDSCLGETYTVPEKPDKPRRKLYIKLPNEILEIAISDKKFNISKLYKIGKGVKVKGEFNKEKEFQVYLLENRDSTELWDFFEWYKGNVINEVRENNDRISAWRVSAVVDDQRKEGIIDVQDIDSALAVKSGIPIFVKHFQKGKFRLKVLFSEVDDAKTHVLTIKERTDGQPWDTFPEHIGIVDHVNYEKSVAHYIVSKTIEGVIKLNQIKDQIEIGDKLLLKLNKITKNKDSYYVVLTSSMTQKEPTEKLLKSFSGEVEISGSVGFADDIYIDSSLIERYGLCDGDYINGTAIINFNKKRRNWGWRAIQIIAEEKT